MLWRHIDYYAVGHSGAIRRRDRSGRSGIFCGHSNYPQCDTRLQSGENIMNASGSLSGKANLQPPLSMPTRHGYSTNYRKQISVAGAFAAFLLNVLVGNLTFAQEAATKPIVLVALAPIYELTQTLLVDTNIDL